MTSFAGHAAILTATYITYLLCSVRVSRYLRGTLKFARLPANQVSLLESRVGKIKDSFFFDDRGKFMFQIGQRLKGEYFEYVLTRKRYEKKINHSEGGKNIDLPY